MRGGLRCSHPSGLPTGRGGHQKKRRPRSARHPGGSGGGGRAGVSLPLEHPRGRARARSTAGGVAHAARACDTLGETCEA